MHPVASPTTASYFCSQSQVKASGSQTLLSTDPHEGWIAFQQGMGIMERGEGKKERERAIQPAGHGDSSREAEVQATHRVPHQEGSLRKEHKLQCR